MIRPYKGSDFEVLENLYNLSKADEFVGEGFDIQVIPLSKDQRVLDLFHSSEIFIYERDGIGGFVGIKGSSIVWLFVHPRYRGQTIGRELVLYVLRKLKGQVTLTVVGSNRVAVSLYKSVGFSILKESIGNHQGHTVIVYKMGIQLGDG